VAKLILLSVVLVSMIIPIRLATRASPKRTLRRVQWTIVAFVFVWALLCIVWYPALVPLE
jgi:hypothetical protein